MTSMTTMTIGRTSILVKFIARTMLAVVAGVAVVTVVTVITVTSVVFKLVFPWLGSYSTTSMASSFLLLEEPKLRKVVGTVLSPGCGLSWTDEEGDNLSRVELACAPARFSSMWPGLVWQ